MSRDVLVTGATGFIGSHLLGRLAGADRRVHALRRATSTVPERARVGAHWHEADVLDAGAVADAVEGMDRVYHLAGVGLANADADTVRSVNVEGTRNVLSACREAGVDRVLFASTAGTRRRRDGVADEADHARPVGAYQESKARAEALVADHVEAGHDAVTVHPTSAFGPGDRAFTGRLLRLATDPRLVAYLPGGASIVGVADLVDGLVAAMGRGTAGEHYVLGGQNLTYCEALAVLADEAGGRRPVVRVPPPVVHALGPAAELLEAATGRRVFPFDRDMARLSTRQLFYSSEKARRDLGYEFRPLAEHAGSAVEWYRERVS